MSQAPFPPSARRGLTPRSSGAPTAGHQARACGTSSILTGPGLASCRRRPLSSNVRRWVPAHHQYAAISLPASPKGLPLGATSATVVGRTPPLTKCRLNSRSLCAPPPAPLATAPTAAPYCLVHPATPVVASMQCKQGGGLRLTPRSRASPNGKTPGPRGSAGYHPPRGPGVSPSGPPYLER